jgi:CubicO group peptidase (beta-lactamase class C family)
MDPLIREIREKADAVSFSGVISIFRAEEEIYNEAFGFADIANIRKNNVSTRFGIASGTKLFTALGIGTLIDQGRITLNTTVHEIFHRDLTWIDSHANIGNLLTHTSGIFDYYDEELISDFEHFFVDIPWYRLGTPSDYLPLFSGKPAKFSSGERFSYSNGGYICLGIIIEKITRQTYRDYVEAAVFAPAQMSDSGYFAFNQLPKNTANGYKLDPNGSYETNIYNLPIRGASDGGAYTTTHDLRKLWSALLDHRILSKDLTARFLSPYVHIHDSLDYGYGVYISQVNGMTVFSIEGGDAGVGFDSRYIPEKRLLINILSNTTNGEEEIREVISDNLADIV